jgi:hypothetical protein
VLCDTWPYAGEQGTSDDIEPEKAWLRTNPFASEMERPVDSSGEYSQRCISVNETVEMLLVTLNAHRPTTRDALGMAKALSWHVMLRPHCGPSILIQKDLRIAKYKMYI